MHSVANWLVGATRHRQGQLQQLTFRRRGTEIQDSGKQLLEDSLGSLRAGSKFGVGIFLLQILESYAGQGFPQQGNLRFFRPFHFLKLVNLDLNLPILVL